MSDYYQLIVPAWRIPDGAEVTKRTGQKPYTLRRTVMLYSCSGSVTDASPGKGKEVVAQASKDAVLLVDERGNINACSAKAELVWRASVFDLRELLEGPHK